MTPCIIENQLRARAFSALCEWSLKACLRCDFLFFWESRVHCFINSLRCDLDHYMTKQDKSLCSTHGAILHFQSLRRQSHPDHDCHGVMMIRSNAQESSAEPVASPGLLCDLYTRSRIWRWSLPRFFHYYSCDVLTLLINLTQYHLASFKCYAFDIGDWRFGTFWCCPAMCGSIPTRSFRKSNKTHDVHLKSSWELVIYTTPDVHSSSIWEH